MGKSYYKSLLAIFALILLSFVSSSLSQSIAFFDDNGSVFALRMGYGGDCANLNSRYMNRATSADITEGNSCFEVYTDRDCRGSSLKLTQGNHDLTNMGFGNKVTSVNLCPSRSRTPSTSVAYIPEKVVTRDQPDNVAVADLFFRQKQPPVDSSPSGTITSQNEIQQIGLDEHNKYRRRLGLQDLQTDAQMSTDAQKWADFLASRNKLEPTTMGLYATNVASSFRRNKVDALKDAIRRWSEGTPSGYNYNDADITKMGIGIALSDSSSDWYIVAYYEPKIMLRPGQYFTRRRDHLTDNRN